MYHTLISNRYRPSSVGHNEMQHVHEHRKSWQIANEKIMPTESGRAYKHSILFQNFFRRMYTDVA